jgi:hypothetical protein
MSNPNETEILDFLIAKLRTIRKDAGYLVNVDPVGVVFGRLGATPAADVGLRIGIVPSSLSEEFHPSNQREVVCTYEITIEAVGDNSLDAFARCSLARRSINFLLYARNNQDGWAFVTDGEPYQWDQLELPDVGHWAMSRSVKITWRENALEI